MIAAALLTLIAWTVAVYGTAAFAEWKPHPASWTRSARIRTVGLWIFGAAFIVIAFLLVLLKSRL